MKAEDLADCSRRLILHWGADELHWPMLSGYHLHPLATSACSLHSHCLRDPTLFTAHQSDVQVSPAAVFVGSVQFYWRRLGLP